MPLVLTTPTVLAMCNEALPNDATATFNLRVKDNEILGPLGIGQGYTVEYYQTNPKTDDTATPIANPEAYTNTVNPKTLYVVVTSPEGCKSYTTLTIKVLPLPLPDTTPDALVLCDDNNSPDGVEEFDLTQAEEDIRNNDDTAIITFHTTEEDAQAGINAIATPSAYPSASGSVWVRMQANTNNPADRGCYQVVELQLIVNPLPAIGDEDGDVDPYAICEPNTDGFAEFDLNSHIEAILGNNSGEEYDIEFYLNQAALDAGTALPRLYTNETPNHQVILVVVTNKETGCSITKPLDLYVEEGAVAHAIAQPDRIECDYEDANDGIRTWDLTVVEAEVLGDQDPAIYEVTYYTSQEDAENHENAIATPEAFQNALETPQTIWVRVTNTATISKCYDLTTITLTVERLAEPVITGEDGSNTICVEFGTNQVLRPLLLSSGVTPEGHTFHWSKDGVALEDNTTGTYLATAAGKYTVQVTGPAPNGCESEESAPFEVIRSGPAKAVGKGYYVSNAFSDSQTITVLVEGYGQYQYSLDNGPRQESNVFTDVAPGPHTVHVWDTKSGEFSCDELILEGVSVIDYPNFFTPNGDGFHDRWNIIGLQDTGSVIYIFDRYGKLMKQISPDSEGWDGTFNGYPVPATDYWFTVTYPEELPDGSGNTVTKEFKAHFSLKR
jgi:gliding motility-associated-like protein